MKTEFKSEDFKLLSYGSYEAYLDSLYRPEDYRYLRRKIHCRLIAELGYTVRDSLTRSQFQQKQTAVHEYLNPAWKVHHLASAGCTPSDNLLHELKHRERANRTHLLQTIIYLSRRWPTGKEISGYIDFADSLQRHSRKEDGSIDWHDIFAERKLIAVSPSDLGYYNWHTGQSITNDTANFRAFTKPGKGLVFSCRLDRQIIYIDPSLVSPGISTTRTEFESTKYEHIVLFDHVARSKY